MRSPDHDQLKCLVLNAGGTYLPDKPAAVAWVAAISDDTTNRPDLVFIQEIPSEEWLDAWCSRGYRVVRGHTWG